jgi:hypothetical protein
MARVAFRYSAGLIALYLLVVNFTGSGQVITRSTEGAVNVVRAFQGR